ncbi:MAG: hypothetical protein AAFN65_11635, partial [Bacteroidota bacterium]
MPRHLLFHLAHPTIQSSNPPTPDPIQPAPENIPPSTPPIDFRAGALLLVDKPIGWTSFDVVNKLRYALRKRYGLKKFKVGHAGTLDPLATGLLLICTGKWTKKLADLTGMPKSYTGTMALGATTPSYDRETEVDQYYPTDHIDATRLDKAKTELTGDIEQLPPMFSAVKIDGQPLYKKARAGEEIARKARPVTIHEFRLGELKGLPQVRTFPESSDPRATASSRSDGMDTFPESSDPRATASSRSDGMDTFPKSSDPRATASSRSDGIDTFPENS